MARTYKRSSNGRFAGGAGGSGGKVNRNVRRAKSSADRKLNKLKAAAIKTEAIQEKNGGLTRSQVNKYMRTGRQAVKAQGKYAAAAQKAAAKKSLST